MLSAGATARSKLPGQPANNLTGGVELASEDHPACEADGQGREPTCGTVDQIAAGRRALATARAKGGFHGKCGYTGSNDDRFDAPARDINAGIDRARLTT